MNIRYPIYEGVYRILTDNYRFPFYAQSLCGECYFLSRRQPKGQAVFLPDTCDNRLFLLAPDFAMLVLSLLIIYQVILRQGRDPGPHQALHGLHFPCHETS